MKQDKIAELTKKAIEAPLEKTKRLNEKTKRLKNPSAEVLKKGSQVSGVLAVGLMVLGAGQVMVTKSFWGIGTMTAGAVTLASNQLYMKFKNK